MKNERPLVVVLLDGVAYERMDHLWCAGHFRRFRRPARVISVFPTLTDPAYDAFFGCGPTPGYEAGYFDHTANRLTGALRLYLSGANEKWVRYTDYRMGFFEDAVMYLSPVRTFRRELRRARRAVEECLGQGRREAVVYILSTDGLGHMLTRARIDELLIELDEWVERLCNAHPGGLELLMLADHGMSVTPTRRFRLRRRLRDAGLRVGKRLGRRGDVVVPVFGLLDFARIHTYDQGTRERVIAALADCAEVELIGWRDESAVGVWTDAGRARIEARVDGGHRRYRYEACDGDPLGLNGVCGGLRAGEAADNAGFAAAQRWLERTADHEFPAAVPRLWDGLNRLTGERADVVVSLAEGWYCGSGLLCRFVRMQGTHGGLHRRVSETFAMSTSWEFPSPIGLEGLSEVLRRRCGWEPQVRGPGGSAVREK